jgi:hypothetical protein
VSFAVAPGDSRILEPNVSTDPIALHTKMYYDEEDLEATKHGKINFGLKLFYSKT